MPDAIDWDGSGEDGGIYAGLTARGLSWFAKAADEQPSDGSVEFIASTASADRMGDSIDQQTWKLANFRANPVILYEHAHPVVGRGKVGLRKGEDGKASELRVRVVWDASEVNPLGLLAAHQHANGFRKAVSVGFLPGETTSRKDLAEGHPLRVTDPNVARWAAGYVFRHNELLEVSTVGVPANRDALQLSMHARDTDDPDEAVRRFVGGSVSKQIADLVLDAVRQDPRIRRAIQAAYLGTPHGPTTPDGTPRWVR